MVKPLSLSCVLAALIATCALAQSAPPTSQQPPQNFTPPQQSPSQPTAPAGRSAAASDPLAGTDTQADVNDCTSRLRASNPRLSAVEIKQYCQRQLNPSSPQD